jgi:hypothetical protein
VGQREIIPRTDASLNKAMFSSWPQVGDLKFGFARPRRIQINSMHRDDVMGEEFAGDLARATCQSGGASATGVLAAQTGPRIVPAPFR